MSEKPRCSKKLHGQFRAFDGSPCGNAGKVERGGKWYCGIHDPVRVVAKQKARDAKWNAKWDAERKAREEVARKREIMEQKAAMFDELVERLRYLIAECPADLDDDYNPHAAPIALALETLAKAEKLK